jgi:hypothetical protein
MKNSKILSFLIESPLYEAWEQFFQEHKFSNVSTAMRYAVKTAIQTDNIIKNRDTDIDSQLITAIDRLSKLELAALELALIQKMGQEEFDRIRRLADRK